jgi:hypothetical protein
MIVRRGVCSAVLLVLASGPWTGRADARPPQPGPRIVRFAGHDWTVKTSGRTRVGPGPNYFSDSAEHVWVDAYGRLHLRIARSGGRWTAAEVVSTASFGRGTYRFVLDSPVDALPPSVVLGLFTWHDDPAFANREIDVEFSRWNDPLRAANAQYAVQPYELAGHLRSFVQPPVVPSTHAFTWRADAIAFQSLAGALTAPVVPSDVIHEWTYAGPVPPPGGEQARMNLWLFQGVPPVDGRPVEVVVAAFAFVP